MFFADGGFRPLPASKIDGDGVKDFLQKNGFQTTHLHDQESKEALLAKFNELETIAKKKNKECFTITQRECA